MKNHIRTRFAPTPHAALGHFRAAEIRGTNLPLARAGEPEEVAATVAFLASDAASLFVGQTLGPNSGDVML